MKKLKNILKNNYLKIFIMSILISGLAFLPFLIYDHGMFLYFGDFNVQQIPFYMHAHDLIKNGFSQFDFYTDLGVNFIGSYSFYLLFSPFFWLTIPFETEAIPYLMAPLLMLKFACSSLTGYAYIQRFVDDKKVAILAALLYSFSGFSTYNIFFNHFHEAIVFFPLLLIGLEEKVENERNGLFALSIAVNAVVNYWFFIGEAIFCAIYFAVKCCTVEKWRLKAKLFFGLAIEVILGMGCSMVAFLPSVLAIMGNTRVGANNLITGTDLWYYSNPQRYLGILHAIFYMPDLPAINNMFPSHGAKWSSLAAYLPLFGAVGTICYLRLKKGKKDWLRVLLVVCFILAIVPAGNHLFVLFNNSYYTRWFYMPVLMMCLATGKSISKSIDEPENDSWEYGLKFSGVVIAILMIISGLTPHYDGTTWSFGICSYVYIFLITTGVTLAGYLAVYIWNRKVRMKPKALKSLEILTVCGCYVLMTVTMLIGKTSYWDNTWMTDDALPNRNQMSMSEEGVFERSDLYELDDNLGMYWNIPNIQCFHSIIPVSIMEFYPQVDVKRDVSSKPSTEQYALRDVLSVRWLYIRETVENQEPMPGYRLYTNQNGYNIYENVDYIPMGFTYDYYINEETWSEIPNDLRSRVMLYAIELEDDAIDRNQDILTQLTEDQWREDLTYEDLSQAAALRRETACETFTITNSGFVAQTTQDQESLMFFSVPYDTGWSATVNGEEVQIEKATIGFMAIRLPEGSSQIEFTYQTPGLKEGTIITAISVTFLLAYLVISRKNRKH